MPAPLAKSDRSGSERRGRGRGGDATPWFVSLGMRRPTQPRSGLRRSSFWDLCDPILKAKEMN